MPCARRCRFSSRDRAPRRSGTRWPPARRRHRPRGTPAAKCAARAGAARRHQRHAADARAPRAAARGRSHARTPSLPMQLSTISPAPSAAAPRRPSPACAAAARASATGSPVYWRTRHSPSSSRRLSMPTTTHCTPKASASSPISCRPLQRRRVDRDLVGAGMQHRARLARRERMPPATQNGMSITPRHALDPAAVDAATFRAGGDVVEHQLVGALVAIAQRQIDDVAHVDVVAEAHALDHAAVAHVQAGNDAAAQHASASAQRLAQREAAFEQRLAEHGAARSRPRAAAATSSTSRTPPEACMRMSGASARQLRGTARCWARRACRRARCRCTAGGAAPASA